MGMNKVDLDHIVEHFTAWKEEDFLQGGLLLVDKPLNWTSFDVVNKLRWAIKQRVGRKLKVGHAGTLDPLATGLLIVGFGRGTKLMQAIQGLDKRYTGHIQLGQQTTTYDAEGEVVARHDTAHITAESVAHAAQYFTGTQQQVPPNFSAIKIGGKKAYEMARKGKNFCLPARPIQIHKFDVTKHQTKVDLLTFDVHCSKGTYIRSLAHDFGIHLKSSAYLSALRRISIGNFHIENAKTIEEWIALLNTDNA